MYVCMFYIKKRLHMHLLVYPVMIQMFRYVCVCRYKIYIHIYICVCLCIYICVCVYRLCMCIYLCMMVCSHSHNKVYGWLVVYSLVPGRFWVTISTRFCRRRWSSKRPRWCGMCSASTAAVARTPPSSKPGSASMSPERQGVIASCPTYTWTDISIFFFDIGVLIQLHTSVDLFSLSWCHIPQSYFLLSQWEIHHVGNPIGPIPSGEHTKSNGKSPCLMGKPIENPL